VPRAAGAPGAWPAHLRHGAFWPTITQALLPWAVVLHSLQRAPPLHEAFLQRACAWLSSLGTTQAGGGGRPKAERLLPGASGAADTTPAMLPGHLPSSKASQGRHGWQVVPTTGHRDRHTGIGEPTNLTTRVCIWKIQSDPTLKKSLKIYCK